MKKFSVGFSRLYQKELFLETKSMNTKENRSLGRQAIMICQTTKRMSERRKDIIQIPNFIVIIILTRLINVQSLKKVFKELVELQLIWP